MLGLVKTQISASTSNDKKKTGLSMILAYLSQMIHVKHIPGYLLLPPVVVLSFSYDFVAFRFNSYISSIYSFSFRELGVAMKLNFWFLKVNGRRSTYLQALSTYLPIMSILFIVNVSIHLHFIESHLGFDILSTNSRRFGYFPYIIDYHTLSRHSGCPSILPITALIRSVRKGFACSAEPNKSFLSPFNCLFWFSRTKSCTRG